MNAPLPDAQARQDALDLSCNPLVIAPAGSGKTGLLVQRLLRALAAVEAPEQCVAITFTNKAAAEIRERVLHWLHLAESGAEPKDAFAAEALSSARAVLLADARHEWNLLRQPDRLRLTTIDAFCNQIAVQLPLLSGLGGAMRVAEDPAALYLEAILALFAELEGGALSPAEEDALKTVLRVYGNRIDALIAPLSVLLGAREQWLPRLRRFGDAEGQRAEDALLHAIVEAGLREFSAALDAHCADLVGLLRDAATSVERFAWARDLHAWPDAVAAQLETYRQLAQTLLTADGKGLRKSRGVNISSGFESGAPYTRRFKQVLDGCAGNERIERAAMALLNLPDAAYPADLRALRAAWLALLGRLAAHLRVVFGRAGQTDFAQIAESAAAALRPDEAYGDALLSADRHIRHLLVDEMQDTSEAQLLLFRQLTQSWTPGDGRSLFLVGDPQQSIYGFRKAEVNLFLELWERRALAELALAPMRLSANFRSAPQVVDWFNAAFTRIFPRAADRDRGAVPFAPSAATREPLHDAGVHLRVFAKNQDSEAAEAAAQMAATLIAGNKRVAVLAHARHHLQPVIDALRARGVPAACQDLDPLAALPEVADYLALVRALWHPADRLSWAMLLRAPFVGLCWADLLALSRGRTRMSWPERIAQCAGDESVSAEGRARLQRLTQALELSASNAALRADLAARAEFVWERLGGPACIDRDALDDLREARACVRARTRGGGIDDLAALDRALTQLYAAPRAGEVQLMTVHKAKGLEFDHVLLIGAHRKPKAETRAPLCLRSFEGTELLVPTPDPSWPLDHPAHALYDFVHREHGESRRNEALRLLYVAITRARESATLFLCAGVDAKGELAFAKDSFAQRLAPVIADHVKQQMPAPVPALEERRELPRAPRLDAAFRMPADTQLYVPSVTRTLKPSAAALSLQEEPARRRDAAELYAQLVGTLYHEALARIAEEGLAAWSDGGASRKLALAAGLRRRGLPEPRIEDAVQRVLSLVARTLSGPKGRWMLEPKAWARSEYALAGFQDGGWISAIVDRCFIDDDGSLWVIDYKTAAHPVKEIEPHVAGGVERYRAQVAEYVRLMRALRPDREVRGALYFAEADRFVEIA